MLAQKRLVLAKVREKYLPDKRVGRKEILTGLQRLKETVRPEQYDVAVFHFSGHGYKYDEQFFLLPHDVNLSSDISILGSRVPMTAVVATLRRIGESGRVLVLISACYSGGS